MRLLHYSAAVLGDIIDEPEQSLGLKPNGLWVSVEGPHDWVSCAAFVDRAELYSVCQEIVLHGEAAVLYITTPAEMDEFTQTFCRRPPSKPSATYTGHIDWTAVAERHGGIVIAPFIHERFLDNRARWYSPWDCASGCIWRANTIERVGCVEAISETREA